MLRHASRWAYQPKRDGGKPGKIICGSVQATPNQTILYAANCILEDLGKAKPSHCGVTNVDGVNVIIQASQLYLINGMNGRENGNANRDLWAVLFATRDQRSSEGFVIRWQHIPGTENPMREPASRAANESKPISLARLRSCRSRPRQRARTAEPTPRALRAAERVAC